MEQSGVHVLVESISAGHTPTAIATIGADGQAEYEFDLAWALRRPADFAQRLVHTGSVATFLEPGASAVRDLLRGTSATEITYDPNIRPALLSSHDEALSVFEDTARLSTVVKMSDEDAAWLYPGVAPDLVLDAVLELGPRLGAMTLGSKGAIIVNADHRVWVPAAAVSVVDTIGAGDTFMASLINSLLISGSENLSREMLDHIGRDAVSAAAITVSRKGADLPWAAEL
jgi:fructokinase